MYPLPLFKVGNNKFALPKIPLSANKGTNPEKNEKSSVVYQLDEPHQIKSTFKIILFNQKNNTTLCMKIKYDL